MQALQVVQPDMDPCDGIVCRLVHAPESLWRDEGAVQGLAAGTGE